MEQYLKINCNDDINDALKFLDRRHGSLLKLLPGIYEQNISWLSNVAVEGTGEPDLGFTKIVGNHKFPESGKFSCDHIKFESKDGIFQEVSSGNLNFMFRSCAFSVLQGYAIEIENMEGVGIFFDCWNYGEDNGFIKNKSESLNLKIYDVTSESTTKNTPMIVCGKAIFFNVHFTHDIIVKNINTLRIEGGSLIEGKVLKG